MEEIRKNQCVELELKDKTCIKGIIQDYSNDRVHILIDDEYFDMSKKFNELDLALVGVKTHMGYKQMFSHVIDKINKSNIITVENNPTIESPVKRREHVRVLSDLSFSNETL